MFTGPRLLQILNNVRNTHDVSRTWPMIVLKLSQTWRIGPLIFLLEKRYQRRPWARIALAAFIVAWLNLAVQPCLMAMESPTEPTTEISNSYHSSHSNGQDRDSCPPAMGNGHHACATSVAAACGIAPDFDFDAGSKLRKFKNASTFVLITELSPTFEFFPRNVPVRSPDRANVSYPSGPPLNVRHCVFLK